MREHDPLPFFGLQPLYGMAGLAIRGCCDRYDRLLITTDTCTERKTGAAIAEPLLRPLALEPDQFASAGNLSTDPLRSLADYRSMSALFM